MARPRRRITSPIATRWASGMSVAQSVHVRAGDVRRWPECRAMCSGGSTVRRPRTPVRTGRGNRGSTATTTGTCWASPIHGGSGSPQCSAALTPERRAPSRLPRIAHSRRARLGSGSSAAKRTPRDGATNRLLAACLRVRPGAPLAVAWTADPPCALRERRDVNEPGWGGGRTPRRSVSPARPAHAPSRRGRPRRGPRPRAGGTPSSGPRRGSRPSRRGSRPRRAGTGTGPS